MRKGGEWLPSCPAVTAAEGVSKEWPGGAVASELATSVATVAARVAWAVRSSGSCLGEALSQEGVTWRGGGLPLHLCMHSIAAVGTGATAITDEMPRGAVSATCG